MQDDLRPGMDAVENLDGAAPRLFARVFIAGEDDGEARRDATGLATALAGAAEVVTVAERADLIVTGSARDGTPGRVALDRSARALLEGAGSPAAVAPRGLADRDDYRLRRVDVGIDGGRDASAALALAVRLAHANDARLRLVAVAEHDEAARETDRREAERLSRRLEHETDAIAGISVETELREGVADQIIIDLAHDADLLVLGSRAAYGNAGRVVIGDLAARILGAAPCPVLVVPAA